jgi:hypothetical protein
MDFPLQDLILLFWKRPESMAFGRSNGYYAIIEVNIETNTVGQIADMSTRTLDFSRHYAARAHQTQRSGPIIGSLPSLNEVEDMLHMQRRNQDALIRIRSAVVNQEQALAEQQMAQRKAFKSEDEHMAMYQEEFKGTGGFAGADPKKRRGVSSGRFFPFIISLFQPSPWPCHRG